MNIIQGCMEIMVYNTMPLNQCFTSRTIKDKNIEMHNDFISQLHTYTKMIRVLAKGYLPIFTSYIIKTTRNFGIGKRNAD